MDIRAGFAKDGAIPWNFKKDWKRFQEITKGQYCIMGRKTYEDIAERKMKKLKVNILPFDEPILKDRESFVLSRNLDFAPSGAGAYTELSQAVDKGCIDESKKIFILGGDKLFIEALPFTQMVYSTIIDHDYECDRFFLKDYLIKHFRISADVKVKEKGKELLFADWRRVL